MLIACMCAHVYICLHGLVYMTQPLPGGQGLKYYKRHTRSSVDYHLEALMQWGRRSMGRVFKVFMKQLAWKTHWRCCRSGCLDVASQIWWGLSCTSALPGGGVNRQGCRGQCGWVSSRQVLSACLGFWLWEV